MVYTEYARTAAVSQGPSHATTKECCKYTTGGFFIYFFFFKRSIKGYTHSELHLSLINLMVSVDVKHHVYLLIQNHMRHEPSESAQKQGIAL